MKNKCNHEYISNSGEGGKPKFSTNRQMSPNQIMHIKCSKCNTRTWIDQESWEAINK